MQDCTRLVFKMSSYDCPLSIVIDWFINNPAEALPKNYCYKQCTKYPSFYNFLFDFILNVDKETMQCKTM